MNTFQFRSRVWENSLSANICRQIRMHIHARVQSDVEEKEKRREERRGRRRRKRRRRKVACTGAELAYRWQRDKTNHRNNRRPPQPASRHGHVASQERIHIQIHTYMNDITTRADYRQARYLYSSISTPSCFVPLGYRLQIHKSCTVFMHLKIKTCIFV